MTVIADNGKGECLIEAPIVNKLCFLPDAKGVKDHVLIARQYRSTDTTDVELAHQRLGHINYQEAARIIGAKPPSKPAFCEACVQGKSTRLPIGSRSPTSAPLHAAPRPGYLLHTDCLGPLRVQSRSGKKYALLFIDDRSRRLFLFLLSSTDQVLPSFKHLTAYLEAEFGRDRVIAQLKSDCDPSCYDTTAFQRFLKQKGIYPIFSAPYTQALNGISERTVRTVLEMTRTMLIFSGAPPSLWGEAMMYAVYMYIEPFFLPPLRRWLYGHTHRAVV